MNQFCGVGLKSPEMQSLKVLVCWSLQTCWLKVMSETLGESFAVQRGLARPLGLGHSADRDVVLVGNVTECWLLKLQ